MQNNRLYQITTALVAVLSVFNIITYSKTCVAQNESVEWRIENIAGVKVVEVRNFLDKLKEAVSKNDKQVVCALIHYPLRITGNSIRNASNCRSQYKIIFNKKVITAINHQRFEDLFVNSQGVMIGDGEVWMSGICNDTECKKRDFKIITVNN